MTHMPPLCAICTRNTIALDKEANHSLHRRDPLQTDTIQPPTMPALCLSCASTIHSHDTHKTPCCTAPICAACIARNPRIVGWVPCLQCGEGVGVVEALAKNRRGRRDDEEEEGLPAYEDVAGIDVGGDDDNDDDEPAHRGQVAVASEADALAQYHQIRRGETIRSIASHYSIDVRSPSFPLEYNR